MEVENNTLDPVMHCSNDVEAGFLLDFRDHLLYIAQQDETHGQQSHTIDCVLKPIIHFVLSFYCVTTVLIV